MTVPTPTGTRIENLAVPPDLLKTRAVDPPNVPVTRRKRPAIRHQRQARPWDRDLRRPAAVHVVLVIQSPIHMHGVPESWAIPIEKPPSFPSRMHVPAYAVEHQRPLRLRIEFRQAPERSSRAMHVLPDPEHLVDDV